MLLLPHVGNSLLDSSTCEIFGIIRCSEESRDVPFNTSLTITLVDAMLWKLGIEIHDCSSPSVVAAAFVASSFRFCVLSRLRLALPNLFPMTLTSLDSWL
jgi:hypothetical protein